VEVDILIEKSLTGSPLRFSPLVELMWAPNSSSLKLNSPYFSNEDQWCGGRHPHWEVPDWVTT
jgi:hypothetical protein